MTYKDLYAKNDIWCSDIEASDVTQRMCPSDYFDCADRPKYCRGGAFPWACEECWNREMSKEKEAFETCSTTSEDNKIDTNNILSSKASSNGKSDSLPHILDSGNRREFETGAVRDIQEGKGRCDLLPLDVVAELLKFIVNDRPSLVFENIYNFTVTGDEHELYLAIDNTGIFKNLPDMLLEVSKHFEEGAKKYGDSNWQRGIPVRCYIDSAVRHYLKYLRGDKDEPHDRAFYWNILCAIWTCKHKPELNDYKIDITEED